MRSSQPPPPPHPVVPPQCLPPPRTLTTSSSSGSFSSLHPRSPAHTPLCPLCPVPPGPGHPGCCPWGGQAPPAWPPWLSFPAGTRPPTTATFPFLPADPGDPPWAAPLLAAGVPLPLPQPGPVSLPQTWTPGWGWEAAEERVSLENILQQCLPASKAHFHSHT